MKMKKLMAIIFTIVISITMFALNVSASFVDGEDGSISYVVDGEPVTGWFNVDGNRYYADKAGNMYKSRWANASSGNRYYFRKDGTAAKGFLKIKENVYYFGANNVMQTGWIKTKSGQRYFAPKTGKMQTGWLTVDNNTYYLNVDNGFMCYGWQQIDAYYYYFDKEGKMVTGKYDINGVTYEFENDGKCLTLSNTVNRSDKAVN